MNDPDSLIRVTVHVDIMVDRSQVVDRQRLHSIVGDEVRDQVDEICRSAMNS